MLPFFWRLILFYAHKGSFLSIFFFFTCVIIMLFNKYLEIPYLPGGWFVLGKNKCSIAQFFFSSITATGLL